MHHALINIQIQLKELIKQIQGIIPSDEPLSISLNPLLPGLTRSELIDDAQSIVDFIEDNGVDDIADPNHEERLQDYVRRIDYLRSNTIAQHLWNTSTGSDAVSAYLNTLSGLQRILKSALVSDEHAERLKTLRKLTAQVRNMEAQMRELAPRTTSLESMVSRIEQAYNAADQLPADLEALAEARKKIENLAQEATRDSDHISGHRQKANLFESSLQQSAVDARGILEKCHTAYSAATSVGLATAFADRSKELTRTMAYWVAGLIAALAAGSYFGTARLQALSELFKQPNVTASVVILNLMLSLLSVGAPIWFGWLATKQIGQRFKLAEDYGYKASISRAYEGFRREAARHGEDMEVRLLASALTRLDELPLRLVESDTHGSPWHELLSSDLVKEAARSVPGFAGQIKEFAKDALDAAKALKGKPAPAPATTAKADDTD
jgi:hypothetical protein